MISVPTFTAMIYAIVKNVVSPARISVRNLDPFLSLTYIRVSGDGVNKPRSEHT